LIPEAVATLVRIIRASNFDAGIRAIAFDSLKKIFIKQFSVKDESIGRELLKVVKFGLTDKSNIVQVRAAQVMLQMLRQADFVSYYSKYHIYSILPPLLGIWKV